LHRAPTSSETPTSRLLTFQLLFFFRQDWGLNLGLQACKACASKAGTLPLDSHLQSVLLCLFWRWGFLNYFPGLAQTPQSSQSQPLNYIGL
jgi:hypothetical protein